VRKFRLSYGHEWVGDGFDAEVGFVRRKDFFRINPEGRLFFYPKKGYFNQHGIGLRTDFLFRPELGKTDHQIRLFWDSDFRNTGGMFVSLTNQYIYLTDSFDPTRTDAQELPGDTGYNLRASAYHSALIRERSFLSASTLRSDSFSTVCDTAWGVVLPGGISPWGPFK
jgi:hypothetical protein